MIKNSKVNKKIGELCVKKIVKNIELMNEKK